MLARGQGAGFAARHRGARRLRRSRVLRRLPPVQFPRRSRAAPAGPGARRRLHRAPDAGHRAQHARGRAPRKECLGCHQRRGGPPVSRRPRRRDDRARHRARDLPRRRRAWSSASPTPAPGTTCRPAICTATWCCAPGAPSAPEQLQEVMLGRRFALDEAGGKRTTERHHDPRGRDAVRVARRSPRRQERRATPLSLELRLVYTIDEFPFRGRELGEPTWATMLTREVSWATLPACKGRGRRAPVSRAPASSARPTARRAARAGG